VLAYLLATELDRAGLPTSVAYTSTSQWDNANSAAAHSIFVQDQWTHGRMTLQGGLRYDRVTSWAPAGGNGTDLTTVLSPVPVRFGRNDSVTGYNDLTPRAGVVFDLFGNGKTALKASVGKYLAAATADGVYSSQNQGQNYVRTATRSCPRFFSHPTTSAASPPQSPFPSRKQ